MRKVERWEATDGTLHLTEREAKRHEATGEHECPKCHGLGRVNGEPIRESVIDEDATAWGGQFAPTVWKTVITGYAQVSCPLCRGKGWTDLPAEPITETRVTGWRVPTQTPSPSDT